MALIIKPPTPPLFKRYQPSVFLAGSIEMGKADNWQARVERLMPDDSVVFNPRRDDWDSSWIQTKDNPQFKAQVTWELSALEIATFAALYFDPTTKSPISLLELGLFNNKMIVCCPEGFWRKGNVDIVCERYFIKQVETLDDLVNTIINKLKEIKC